MTTPKEEAVALNFDRAYDVEKALIAYVSAKEARRIESLAETSQDHIEWLIDLLTDIRHYCRQYELPFDNAVCISEGHFESEVDDERLADEQAEGGGAQ